MIMFAQHSLLRCASVSLGQLDPGSDSTQFGPLSFAAAAGTKAREKHKGAKLVKGKKGYTSASRWHEEAQRGLECIHIQTHMCRSRNLQSHRCTLNRPIKCNTCPSILSLKRGLLDFKVSGLSHEAGMNAGAPT